MNSLQCSFPQMYDYGQLFADSGGEWGIRETKTHNHFRSAMFTGTYQKLHDFHQHDLFSVTKRKKQSDNKIRVKWHTYTQTANNRQS